MKTYGRPSWRASDDVRHPAAKKRRVSIENNDEPYEARSNLQCAIRDSSAAVLSSASSRPDSSALSDEYSHDDKVTRNDEDDDTWTPPSSPPPRLSPPPENMRKPTFSFLKRKRMSNNDAGSGFPLSEVNSNSMRFLTDLPAKKPASWKPALKQMQIDLGHDMRKTCNACGMEYVPSNAEDAALHKKFHDMNSTGVDLGKAFMRANASRWVYEATRFDGGYVVIIDRKASPTAKSQVKKVLEVVNKELSSPQIEDDVLWSQTEPPKRLEQSRQDQDGSSSEKTDRFRVFLHMKDSRCVGLCLTERIWESRPLDCTTNGGNRDGNITVCDEIHPAIVGISRIWTSTSSRRKGIAMDLLDCLVSNFIYGMEIPEDQIAFSQPTESGRKLAEAFFGPGEQWHVYSN